MMLTSETPIPPIGNATLSANCFGLSVSTKEGKKAHLAIVDEQGEVLEMGEDVRVAVWLLMLNARNNFLEGLGHLRVLAPAPDPSRPRINKQFFMDATREAILYEAKWHRLSPANRQGARSPTFVNLTPFPTKTKAK